MLKVEHVALIPLLFGFVFSDNCTTMLHLLNLDCRLIIGIDQLLCHCFFFQEASDKTGSQQGLFVFASTGCLRLER